MIEKVLGIFENELTKIAVPYEFLRWTADVEDRYWVGEYSEIPTDSEDGYKEISLILTGTARGSMFVLHRDRAKIEGHFPSIGGLRLTTDKGAVVIFYENSFPVPTGEANLNRMQINLRVKAWKGTI